MKEHARGEWSAILTLPVYGRDHPLANFVRMILGYSIVDHRYFRAITKLTCAPKLGAPCPEVRNSREGVMCYLVPLVRTNSLNERTERISVIAKIFPSFFPSPLP